MNNPLVSVIIPAYNAEKYIAEAIDSVLAQTYPAYEIIVVDDGSTDRTKEIVETQGHKDTGTHVEIRYMYQENRGPAAARNAGIKIAKGEYMTFLDADDIWLKNKLEIQVKEMADGIGLAGVGSCDGNIEHTKNISYKELLIKNRFYNSGVMVKKECLDKVGLFDERPEFKAVEDWDMWIRISKYYKTRYINSPLVKVRVTQDSISSAKNAEKMLHNELSVLKKNFSENSMNVGWLLKLKSYSYRYYVTAIAYREVKQPIEARKHVLRAISLYPLIFFNRERFVFAVNAILGLYRAEQ